MRFIRNMATDLRSETNKEATRLSTLLLGLAASAIAFAIHETSDWKLEWALLPIALGLLSWGVSFYAGIQWAHTLQGSMSANIALHEAGPNHPRYPDIDAALDRYRRAGGRWYRWQLRLLLLGATCYVVGHAMHIALQPAAKDTVSAAAKTRPAQDR
jgi:hypothetical protein